MIPIWLTYSWTDNPQGDVDFIAQELERAGLTVRLDRWNLTAGRRLWEQIGEELSKPDLTAWIILATANSCGSQACKEELAYALDRALDKKGAGFPVIALFPSAVEADLLPASLKTRLCVSLMDQAWIERCKSAAERRAPAVPRQQQEPYHAQVHEVSESSFGKYAIELRPRAGSWAPFFAAIPLQEKESVKMTLAYGPKNHVPNGSMLWSPSEGESDGRWACWASNEATPTMSYYVFCTALPSSLDFGQLNAPRAHQIKVTRH